MRSPANTTVIGDALVARHSPLARGLKVVIACTAIAILATAVVGCGGGDDDTDASATTGAARDRSTTTTEPPSDAAGALVIGECPVTDDDVSNAIGAEMPANGECHWFDGVITLSVTVNGGTDLAFYKDYFSDRDYEIKDLDRGDGAFVATSEVEAHALVVAGDAAMTIDMSGLTGADRFESIALDLMDAALD